MKNCKYIFSIIFLGLILSSCGDEFLNPTPVSSVVADNFFSSDAELLSGVYSMYDAAQGVNENTQTNWNDFNRGIQFEYLVTEMRSDNSRSQTTEGSKADFHRYLVNANNREVEDYYASMFEIIFRANTVLSFIDVADPNNRDTYSGEAKFMRAYAYFNLVRLYGDVPLITTPVNPSDEVVFVRVAVSTVYDQIISDLTDAMNNLDYGGSQSRASKGAAQTLLAKVYLSLPTPDYIQAQSLCESVMSGGGYALQDSFPDIFYNERNSELIFIVEYIPANADESQSFSSEFNFFTGRQDGLNIPEPNLITALTEDGGKRFDGSIALSTTGAYECAKYFPDGFGVEDDYGPNSRAAGNDWIVMRYADVYLMHAEAILAGAPTTSSVNAINSVNEVRERAGMPDITGELEASDLLQERRVEFAFENHRFFDLQRFGVMSSVIAAYAAEAGYDFNVNQLVLPIPAREVNLSKGLMAQNPGY